MQEYFFLTSIYDCFCMPDGVVEFCGELFKGQTIYEPTLEHCPVAFAVTVFVNSRPDLAVGIFLHFFTLPEPWHRGHFLYPVLPPVLRTRFLVTVCFAIGNHPASADIVVNACA